MPEFKHKLLKRAASKQMLAVPASVLNYSPTSSDKINELPNELLTEILKIYMESQHVRRNADLMLVCKRWRSLVSFTPQLWNRIEVAPHSSLQNMENCRRLAEFCLTKSWSLPLDIVVDFGDLWDPKFHPHVGVEKFLFANLASNHSGKEVLDDVLDCALSRFNYYIDKLFSSLVGSDRGCDGDVVVANTESSPLANIHFHAERWRSLRITFAEWMDYTNLACIFSSMKYPAPMLDTLVIHHCFGGAGITYGVEEAFRRTLFPVLRVFSINTGIDLSYFGHGDTSLQSLALYIQPESFRCLPQFRSLRFLHLILETTSAWETAFQAPVHSILLPHLLTLRLTGNWSHLLLPLINAPRIWYLRLSNDVVLHYPESDLLGHLRSLNWDIDLCYKSSNDVRRSLTSVLKQCRKLVKITTWSAGKTTATNRMKNLVDDILKEQPLASLRSVTYLDRSGGDFDSAVAQEVVEYRLVASIGITVV